MFQPLTGSRPVCPCGRCRLPVLMVVNHGTDLARALEPLCAALDVCVATITDSGWLPRLLAAQRPIAVLAGMDSPSQDGCHVMMQVAGYDPSLPMLLLTGPDPALLGAAEAVRDAWGLTDVRLARDLPAPHLLAEFLCRAAHRHAAFDAGPAPCVLTGGWPGSVALARIAS